MLVAVAPHGRAGGVRATASMPPTARIVAVGNTPVSAVVDERTGLVFVLNLNRPPNPDPTDAPGGARPVPGTVSVFDPLRGRVLCTVRVGTNPASTLTMLARRASSSRIAGLRRVMTSTSLRAS